MLLLKFYAAWGGGVGESNDCKGNTKVAHVESFAGLCFLGCRTPNGTLTTLVPATCKGSPLVKTDSKQLEKDGKDKSPLFFVWSLRSKDVFLFIWSPYNLRLRQRLIKTFKTAQK